jgi:hypothetical protein
LDIFSIKDKCVPIAVGIKSASASESESESKDKDGILTRATGYTVREDQPQYTIGIDPDPDSDPDTDGNREQTDRQQWLQATAKPRLSQTMKKYPNPK